jgi:imidazole glycerol-phosphate synthase subunit HisH
MIAIIDYDIGNISAVANMLLRLGLRSKITSRADDVEAAERIILPGNGSFDACVRNLRATGLIPLLESKVLVGGTPLLGICVGAQMLGTSSEEGSEPGLGWIEMQVRRFPRVPGLPVPHMGWNQVQHTSNGHRLTRDMDDDARFYFVHSYYMAPSDPQDVLLMATYGIEFAAGVSKGNIAGVQFHPEKSHRFGKQLLAAFAGSQ